MTSEEAERQSKNTISAYYKSMWANILFGALLLIAGIIRIDVAFLIFGAIFIFAPSIICYISQEKKEEQAVQKITKRDVKYCLEVAKKTWKFFEDNINQENNFLPPDNYQWDRKEKIAHRTSPTNIGLGLLAVCSSYDLGFIDLNHAIDLIQKMITTIENLQKWNGHLYNWYNTKTLEPLVPRYVSTVDSGNFIRIFIHIKAVLN